MFQETRKEEIMDLLKEKKRYKIEELYKYFGVSLATIHRDLNELEREGRVQKVYGGVLLKTIDDFDMKNHIYDIRIKRNMRLKEKIAKKVLDFVKSKECIFIDNSTTCYYFAKELAKSKFNNIIVVTNSNLIPNLFLKNDGIQVVSTGGVLLKDFSCFVGSSAIRTINDFNGNKFFFSTAAISVEGECSDVLVPDSYETKKEMLKKSDQSICLIDSTKFNKKLQTKVISLSDVDQIITDNNCTKETREEFASIDKKLIIA